MSPKLAQKERKSKQTAAQTTREKNKEKRYDLGAQMELKRVPGGEPKRAETTF